MKERGHMEELNLDGGILLKRIIKKLNGVGMNYIDLAKDTDRG